MDQDEFKQWTDSAGWLDGADLATELVQAEQEGRDLSTVEDRFAELLESKSGSKDLQWRGKAAELIDRVQSLPSRSDYIYVEPNDLEAIRKVRAAGPAVQRFDIESALFKEKLAGGLVGRMCGCLLGKPFEGWHRQDMGIWGEETGNWPLADYLQEPTSEQAARIRDRGSAIAPDPWRLALTRDHITHMAEDDDINYTVTGWDVVRRKGASFRSIDVAEYWCNQLPTFRTFTAERVAYRNFLNGVLPPESAICRNPFREWIGAQIRADFFGYANPGDPERAAEWAWRDARCSHIRNGIYGEMWVAAMLASAYVLDTFEEIIRAGLAQIPAECRLHGSITRIVQAWRDGNTYEQQVDEIHSEWNEREPHGWCHTISNAEIVAVALLHGGNDYSNTISRAVMPGFDTDCNGATAGSVWGIRFGRSAIPERWTAPLNDKVRTHLNDWREVSIGWLIDQMVETSRAASKAGP